MDTLPRRMKDSILKRERPGNLTGDATAEETHCPAKLERYTAVCVRPRYSRGNHSL